MAITTSRYGFNKDAITKYAPEKAGVYCLYSYSNLIIYYGMSENSIRQRLLDHLNGTSGNCHQTAHSFNFIENKSPKDTEKQLLLEYHRTYGQLPQCNEVMP